MKFKNLAKYLQKLEDTSSRLQITDILSDLFKNSGKDEIDKVTYLILGGLVPEYRGIVFNIAEKLMLQIFANTYKKDLSEVKKLYKEKGDLGETVNLLALESETNDLKSELSINEVYEKLFAIAEDCGENSVERKIDKTSELFKSLDPLSCKYVARIPVGKLRLGFSDKTILDALSWMETGGKDKRKVLEQAYDVLPDVGSLARNVKKKGIDKTVSEIKPEVGVPILPMLASRLKSPKEMINKMKKVYVEPKFDGLRIQLHYKKEGLRDYKNQADKDKKLRNVLAFTRKPNEVSWMFPELSELGKHIKAKDVILDTEAIGVDESIKKMANFQTTMTRRRKHDIAETAKKVSIKFNVFDIMLKNGKSLVDNPYHKRRDVLAKTVKSGKLIEVVDFQETDSPEKISELMRKELGEGLEGIIVKKVNAKYISGRTGFRWVKMKEKESQKAKLADTLDCVVMGYYKGRGKRTAFGLGGFLVGIIDSEKVKSFTKIGTGLTDDQFKELKKRLTEVEVKDKPEEFADVDKTLKPDNWVKPSQVVEIAADEITKSPMHTSGFALRFPRLVKIRDDKNWTGATTLSEVRKLFKLQK